MSIYAIWGPPHSGKTTLAIDLATALSSSGQSVCLISPEQYSELSARLNINIPESKSLGAAFTTTTSLNQVAYKVNDLLYVLAAPSYGTPFIEDASSEDIKKMLLIAGGLFDCVIVDCPPRMDSLITAWAMNLATKVLLLSGSQVSAVLWHHTFASAIECIRPRMLPLNVMTNKTFDYQELHRAVELYPQISVPFVRDAEVEQSIKQTLYRSGTIKGYSSVIDDICRCMKGGD